MAYAAADVAYDYAARCFRTPVRQPADRVGHRHYSTAAVPGPTGRIGTSVMIGMARTAIRPPPNYPGWPPGRLDNCAFP